MMPSFRAYSIIAAGCAALTVAYLFPPWRLLHLTKPELVTAHLGFAWRWSPPVSITGVRGVVAIDSRTLLIEMLIIGLVCVVLVAFSILLRSDNAEN